MLFDGVVSNFYRNIDKGMCLPENTKQCTMQRMDVYAGRRRKLSDSVNG